ncbi:MAG: phosphomannomutase/phosphoglucomutase, partial [Firmicutes bacterium]|nr:phosphomannomutase/phosphoglucomutase [Bacillota bacterium]
MGIFKACDIRGVYNRDLTERDAYNLGRAAGQLARGQTALVAGDVRLSTPELKQALGAGLVKAGYAVTDIGIVTTPIFYYASHQTGQDLGIMVTASHNPKEYNGFKLLLQQKPINDHQLASLAEIMVNQDCRDGARAGSCVKDNTW